MLEISFIILIKYLVTPPLPFTTPQILTRTLILSLLSIHKKIAVQISTDPPAIHKGGENIHSLKFLVLSPLAKKDTHGKGTSD